MYKFSQSAKPIYLYNHVVKPPTIYNRSRWAFVPTYVYTVYTTFKVILQEMLLCCYTLSYFLSRYSISLYYLLLLLLMLLLLLPLLLLILNCIIFAKKIWKKNKNYIHKCVFVCLFLSSLLILYKKKINKKCYEGINQLYFASEFSFNK